VLDNENSIKKVFVLSTNGREGLSEKIAFEIEIFINNILSGYIC